jgi:hypothetical protein
MPSHWCSPLSLCAIAVFTARAFALRVVPALLCAGCIGRVGCACGADPGHVVVHRAQVLTVTPCTPSVQVMQAQEQNSINKLLVNELDRVKADQHRMNEELLALRLENLKLTSILRDRLEPPSDAAERTSQALLSSPKLQRSSRGIPLKDQPLVVFDLTKDEPTALAANKQFCALLGYSQAEGWLRLVGRLLGGWVAALVILRCECALPLNSSHFFAFLLFYTCTVVGQPWTRFVPGEYITRTLRLMTSQPPVTVFDQVYR